MAFYRMSGSSKGELHGASITVEADISLAGQTVELYLNGAMVKSGTLSEDASYLFTDILEAGTYTAEVGSFSGSVEVSADDILNKVAKRLSIGTTTTITLTLEGANGDNIKVTDKNGDPVAVYVFNGTTCTQDINIIDGEEYTFTSSIAKDTTSGTSNYSITVPITTSTTNVKVMPEGALYWYGNECVDVTGGWGASGYTLTGYTVFEGVKQANLMYLPTQSTSKMSVMGTTNEISNAYSKIKLTVSDVSSDNYVQLSKSKAEFSKGVNQYKYIMFNTNGTHEIEVSDLSNIGYVNVQPIPSAQSKVSRIWFE